MDHADLPLIHLVQRPRRPNARPPLLLLLHGVGSNEHDLFSLAPHLDPRLLILSARAPNVIGPEQLCLVRGGVHADRPAD